MNADEIIRGFETLCLAAMRISGETQDRPAADWRNPMASLVFSRIALNGASILRITPESRFCSQIAVPELSPEVAAIQVWDLPSVAALSRNLAEAYLTLHYLAQPACPAAEAAFRQKVWFYHEACERLQMLQCAVPDSPSVPVLEQEVARQRQGVEQDAGFHQLVEGRRRKVANGKLAKLLTNEELCLSAGVNPSYYNSMFKYGSNHTHSSPFSYAQMDAFSATDGNARKVFQLALQTSAGFTALAIRDYARLFPDQALPAKSRERELVELWEGILKWDINAVGSKSPGAS